MKGLGDRLRALREQRGLSMSGLARAAGVSRSYVWRLEHEQRQLNTRIIERLAAALEVEPAVLIGGIPRAAARQRQESLLGHLLSARPLNPQFVAKVLQHVLEDLLPDDPELTTVRDWDARLLDMGSRGALLRRISPKAGEIAERLDQLDRSMSYAEFRQRMLRTVADWPPERRQRFVGDLLPEILRRPGHYRRLTSEEIFLSAEVDLGRLRRFPLLLEGDDPRAARLGRSGRLDVAEPFSGEGLFAFRMPDDSMAPRCPAGSVLIVDGDREPTDGEPSVIRVDGLTTTCRTIRHEGDTIRLIPANSGFPEAAHPAADVRWSHPVTAVLANVSTAGQA